MRHCTEQDEAGGELRKRESESSRESAAPRVPDQDGAAHTKLLQGACDQRRLACR
jgi:hypothetical protein